MSGTHKRKRLHHHGPLADTKSSTIQAHQKRMSMRNAEDYFVQKAHQIEAELINNQNTKSPLLANQMMGRYGITNMKAFLESPGGKALKNLLERKLLELETLRKKAIQTEQDKARQRTLTMLVLSLAYDKKSAAARREYYIETEQKILDKKLHPKGKSKASYDADTLRAYQESAKAINEELAAKTALLAEIDAEWDKLEVATQEQHARDTFFDALLTDITQLFALTEEDSIHLTHLKKPELHHILQENQVVHRDGRAYLIPKHATFESLSQEEQAAAEKNFKAIKPRLEKAVKASRDDEATRITNKKIDLIHKAARLHQDIRVLTQQLKMMQQAIGLITASLTPDAASNTQPQLGMRPHPNQPNYDTSALFSSYKMLNKAMVNTESTKERQPILDVLHEDIDPIFAKKPELDPLDITTINRWGGPQFLAELHQFKQGANNITSAAHMQFQTSRSILKNAERLAGLVSESPAARRFQIDEALDAPKPKPASSQATNAPLKEEINRMKQEPAYRPEEEQENQPENTQGRQFRPKPFSTNPFE
ncbi:MAG: hypothetical protein P1U32_04950 [Legionellaceae bacterium]|nr:hypothetical protein [Legionellaceae bacterium]